MTSLGGHRVKFMPLGDCKVAIYSNLPDQESKHLVTFKLTEPDREVVFFECVITYPKYEVSWSAWKQDGEDKYTLMVGFREANGTSTKEHFPTLIDRDGIGRLNLYSAEVDQAVASLMTLYVKASQEKYKLGGAKK